MSSSGKKLEGNFRMGPTPELLSKRYISISHINSPRPRAFKCAWHKNPLSQVFTRQKAGGEYWSSLLCHRPPKGNPCQRDSMSLSLWYPFQASWTTPFRVDFFWLSSQVFIYLFYLSSQKNVFIYLWENLMDVNMDLRDILEFFFFRKRKNDWFYFTILYIFYKNNIKISIKWLIINVNIH